jgi:Uma2 family endonuclease
MRYNGNLPAEGFRLSSVAARHDTVSGRCIRLSNVTWSEYTKLLRIFGERPRIRLTFDRGELEIMSPLLEHDFDGSILGQFVVILTDELDLPFMPGGSTTMRRRERHKGIESDECYWIASAPRMAGKRRLDLRIDPPPDLAIEVDESHSSLDRMGIYAALKVPEVWRLDGDGLTFHVLDEHGEYQQSTTSHSFPVVQPADLFGFLRAARQAGNQQPVFRRFRAWVRKRMVGRSGSGKDRKR